MNSLQPVTTQQNTNTNHILKIILTEQKNFQQTSALAKLLQMRPIFGWVPTFLADIWIREIEAVNRWPSGGVSLLYM